ncbi:predicted protein [Naegleria gruberi]|uniref:Predicted protein n=1 Tax=Naegleria gruberi TaxID=5762 RepID=D2V8J5_NAEGR|nr:uncharacterized protein NAEGRDRAFT_65180 [Naegleria gruberi]EFC46697.1 predicted protein [Naegleria gruberi]|eukprot:XP_002679441.1 predicted protein [Naegleria gruberi strain NEG-M]
MRKSTSEKTLPETINIKNPSEDEKSTLQQQDWFCELVSTYTEHKINALEKENQNLIQKLLALTVDQRYIKFLESIPSLMQKQQEHNKQGNSDNEYKKLNEKLDEVIDDYEDVKRKLKKAEENAKKPKMLLLNSTIIMKRILKKSPGKKRRYVKNWLP